MVSIIHGGKFDPYDRTVYDEKWLRIQYVHIWARLVNEMPKMYKEYAKELKEQGRFNDLFDD